MSSHGRIAATRQSCPFLCHPQSFLVTPAFARAGCSGRRFLAAYRTRKQNQRHWIPACAGMTHEQSSRGAQRRGNPAPPFVVPLPSCHPREAGDPHPATGFFIDTPGRAHYSSALQKQYHINPLLKSSFRYEKYGRIWNIRIWVRRIDRSAGAMGTAFFSGIGTSPSQKPGGGPSPSPSSSGGRGAQRAKSSPS